MMMIILCVGDKLNRHFPVNYHLPSNVLQAEFKKANEVFGNAVFGNMLFVMNKIINNILIISIIIPLNMVTLNKQLIGNIPLFIGQLGNLFI